MSKPTAIYRPGGRAREYAHLAINLYTGCPHGCTYCYVPSIRRISPKKFQSRVRPREGIIESLRAEAPHYAGTCERVLLCFSCDPYPRGIDTAVTRQAIEVLRQHDIPFTVLSKGGRSAIRDFDLYGPHDMYGVTMTLSATSDCRQLEPHAATAAERAATLHHARQRRILTWASLEPVLDPTISLALIENIRPYADYYRLGKLNHDPLTERKTDWQQYATEAVRLCERLHAEYFVKSELAEYLIGVKYTNTDLRTVRR